MKRTDFVARAQSHLSAYKATSLGIQDDGIWASNKKAYPHILPADRLLNNLLESVRPDYDRLKTVFHWKLHRDFHHLTSSQALAFNLFLPLVASWPGSTSAYGSAFAMGGDIIESASLEVVLDREEGTNLDAVTTTRSGARLLIEVKFTEGGFGSASPDHDHLAKLESIYKPMLSGRIEDECLQPKAFFTDYQLFRNLANLRRGSKDRLMLLLPRQHRSMWTHATEWVTDPRLRAMTESLSVLALEDVLSRLATPTTPLPDALARHAQALVLKYSVPKV